MAKRKPEQQQQQPADPERKLGPVEALVKQEGITRAEAEERVAILKYAKDHGVTPAAAVEMRRHEQSLNTRPEPDLNTR